ncbi:MAG: hypothetical protein ACT4NY_16600 [Pseudonocardiales bacterium]
MKELLEFPGTRGDDFFDYPVGLAPYPSLNGEGQLVVPDAHKVG